MPVAKVLIAIASFLSIGAQAAPAAETVVIAVRHAEKDPAGGADPALSAAGRERAAELARMLADSGISAIYVSDTARARQTAEPLAKARGLTPIIVSAADVQELARAVLAVRPGSRVLVVGHSNTVPDLIRRLGGGEVAPLGDGEYDRMFVVVLSGDKHSAAVTPLRYGAHP